MLSRLLLKSLLFLICSVGIAHADWFGSPNWWSQNSSGISNTNTGNVGVGSVNPSQALDVQGTVRTTNLQDTSVTSKILKTDGSGNVSGATASTDYAPATSGSAILYGNGTGGFSSVTISTGLNFTGGTLKVSQVAGSAVSKTTATDYTAATDVIVQGSIRANAGNGGNQDSGAQFCIKASASPCTSPDQNYELRTHVNAGSTTWADIPFMFFVAKNQHYQLSLQGPDSSSLNAMNEIAVGG